VCFVVGCQDKAAVAELEELKAQAALEEENKALIMRQVDAFQKHDVEALREVYSPNLVSHNNQVDLTLEEMLAEFEQTTVMFPDFTLNVGDIFVKGDKAAGRYSWTGTHTGDIEGFPATGKEVKVIGVAIFHVENGKIVEEWFGSNQLDFYQQLGFEMMPKEEEK
jgi:steroid delta-isomerase-like uncharacterized protein